jgi:subtilisin-like proprotein convertase family protein
LWRGENLAGTFSTILNPVDSLSLVPQERMDGDWTLIVEDADVGPIVREGVLNSWGMLITEQVVTADLASPIIIVGLTNGISLRA